MEKPGGINAEFIIDIRGLGKIFRVETATGETFDFANTELLKVTYNPGKQKFSVLCTNAGRSRLFGYKEIARTTTCWDAEKPIDPVVISTPNTSIS